MRKRVTATVSFVGPTYVALLIKRIKRLERALVVHAWGGRKRYCLKCGAHAFPSETLVHLPRCILAKPKGG